MIKSKRKLRPLSSFFVFLSILGLLFVGYGISLSLGNFVALHWIALIGVFFAVLFQPSVIPMVSTLLLGLFVDGFEATPFGFYALGFLFVHHMVYYQRRFLLRRPFNVIWTGFVINTSLMAALLSCVMWFMDTLPTLRLLFSLIVLWTLFPVVYMVMNRLFQGLEED